MSKENFSDDCSGCRPVLIDPATQEALPDSDPIMQAVLKVWIENTTFEQRKAWHAVMCQNSRSPEVLELANQLVRKMNQLQRSH